MGVKPVNKYKLGLGALLAIVSSLIVFQNCGKTDSSGDASFLGDTNDDKKFKAAPFPFDFNFNQVAYMTCPAVQGGSVQPDDLDNPFFTIRAGAYDNRQLATRFPNLFTQGLQEPEKTYRLKAGVGLKKEYLQYIKTNFSARLDANQSPDTLKKLLRDGIVSSNFSSIQPLAGLIFRQRSSQGFAWDQNAAKNAFETLNEVNAANALVNGLDMGNYGFEHMNYLTGVTEPSQRALTVSINASKDEATRDFIMQQMGTNLQVSAGFGAAGDASVFSFLPTENNNRVIYGRTYRFTTSRQWPGRVDIAPDAAGNQISYAGSSITSDFVTGVQEVDTSAASERDLTAAENQKWDCFALMVVRDFDRRDPLTNKAFDPDYDTTLWTGNKKNKFYDYQAAPTSPVVPGVKAACPPQEIGDGTKTGTLNYVNDGGLSRLRLEIARRFLPAGYWDINTNPEYMCAVPRKTTQGFGRCYASGTGDFDPSMYVMYTQQGVANNQAVTCGRVSGTIQNECPAFVSICYRSR